MAELPARRRGREEEQEGSGVGGGERSLSSPPSSAPSPLLTRVDSSLLQLECWLGWLLHDAREVNAQPSALGLGTRINDAMMPLLRWAPPSSRVFRSCPAPPSLNGQRAALVSDAVGLVVVTVKLIRQRARGFSRVVGVRLLLSLASTVTRDERLLGNF